MSTIIWAHLFTGLQSGTWAKQRQAAEYYSRQTQHAGHPRSTANDFIAVPATAPRAVLWIVACHREVRDLLGFKYNTYWMAFSCICDRWKWEKWNYCLLCHILLCYSQVEDLVSGHKREKKFPSNHKSFVLVTHKNTRNQFTPQKWVNNVKL